MLHVIKGCNCSHCTEFYFDFDARKRSLLITIKEMMYFDEKVFSCERNREEKRSQTWVNKILHDFIKKKSPLLKWKNTNRNPYS